jgi:hypothetical protein
MAYLRKEQKVSKLSVVVSVALHLGIIAILIVMAARQGMFGKHFKKMVVTMVPNEPLPERPKEIPSPAKIDKPPELKPVSEPANVQPPTLAKDSAPAQAARPDVIPPPAIEPLTAPPPAAIPDLLFDGGSKVQSSSDPKALYKSFVEYTLRSNWKRPDNLVDLGYVAEVEVGIDRRGQITSQAWMKGSGNPAWDNSVRQALAQTKTLERTPPNGFPGKVLVRFDVQKEADALKP